MCSIISHILLPVIFVLHNYEEYRNFDQFRRIYLSWLSPQFSTVHVFLCATIFLDLIVLIVALTSYYSSHILYSLVFPLLES